MWRRLAPVDDNKAPLIIQTVPDQVVTGNGTAVASYTSVGGHFLWMGSMYQATSASFKTRIKALWEGNYLDQDVVKASAFWGTAQNISWHPPKLVPSNMQFSFELTDYSGSSNTIRLYLIGRYVTDAEFRDLDRRYGAGRGLFVMNTPAAGFVIGASQMFQNNLTVESAYHFRAHLFTSVQTSTNWLGNLTWTDPRINTSIRLSANRVHQTCLAGTAANPFILPSPPVWQKGSSVSFDMLDASGSQNTVDFYCIGERLGDNPADWA